MIKRKAFYITISIILFLVFLFGILFSYASHISGQENIVRNETKFELYECDVKSLNLNTKIIIDNDGEEIATISGNVFKVVVDPLTMYDKDNEKIGYAGDSYHFISQDSHGIYMDNQFKYDMVGKVDFWGDTYEIYDANENLIAKMKFNMWNTKGIMYDTSDNMIAEYESKYYFNDYSVRIYDNCEFDTNSILMMFASFYSDRHADQ